MSKIQVESQKIQIDFFPDFTITEESLWKLTKNNKVGLLPNNRLSIQTEKDIVSLEEAASEITHFYTQNL